MSNIKVYYRWWLKNVKEQFNSNLSIDRIFFFSCQKLPTSDTTDFLTGKSHTKIFIGAWHTVSWSIASLGNSYMWLIKEMSVRKPSYSIWVNIFLWSKSEVLYWKICAVLSKQIGNCPTPLRKLVGIQRVWLVFFFNLKQQLTIWY